MCRAVLKYDRCFDASADAQTRKKAEGVDGAGTSTGP